MVYLQPWLFIWMEQLLEGNELGPDARSPENKIVPKKLTCQVWFLSLYWLTDTEFQRALEGQVSKAEVSWMGDGIWEPESICFDWTNDDFKVRRSFTVFQTSKARTKYWGYLLHIWIRELQKIGKRRSRVWAPMQTHPIQMLPPRHSVCHNCAATLEVLSARRIKIVSILYAYVKW